MDEHVCILVLGAGPLALAVARAALLSGAAPAIYAEKFSAPLDQLSVEGVLARLARDKNTFLAGLRQKAFIPVLDPRLAGNVERWPWDVVVDARVKQGAGRKPHGFAAPLRIALGAGPVAGEDCELVVDVDGPDPGALIRKGSAPARADLRGLFGLEDAPDVLGPREKMIARAVIFAIESERGGWAYPQWPAKPCGDDR
jgi:xanthine dehydrogenase accessory factor